MYLASTERRRELAGNRGLVLLLTAGLISQSGDWMLSTAITFEVYALTGSTVASATTLLATQVPQLVFGAVAGVAADRWDRRRLMVGVNLALAVVLVPLLTVRSADRLWIVFAVVALSSCLAPFFTAADAAVLPGLVPAQQLVRANALNGQVRNISRLSGAALGGVLLASGGLTTVVVADLVSFTVAAALLLGLPRRRRVAGDARRSTRSRSEWVGGVSALRANRPLQVVLVFFLVGGIGEAAMGSLFAPFVHDVLGGDGATYGTILAAQAIGGIGGGLVLSLVAHRIAPRTLFAGGALLLGVGDLVLFFYPLFYPGLPGVNIDAGPTAAVWPAYVVIALVGLPAAAATTGVLTIFQRATGDELRGRVFGVFTTAQGLAMVGSTLIVGPAAARWGVVAVISVQAVAYLLIGVVAWIGLRRAPGMAGVPSENSTAGARADDADALLDIAPNSIKLATMGLPSNVRFRTVSDPVALRALAHPLRQELYGLVGREGSLTAADAARQLDVSHALASHHLRQLAKYGFLEPAEAGDSRERPWRVTATSMNLDPQDPGARATNDAIDRYAAERAMAELARWQQRRAEAEPDWAAQPGVRSGLLYLTPAELSELLAEWQSLLVRRAEERPIGHADRRPDDAEPVSLTLIAAPLVRTESGG